MRPIKFRGRSMLDGEWLYGDLIHGYANSLAIIGKTETHCVVPETVAQLVGYDKHGNEVYEDDELISDIGTRACAANWELKNFLGFEVIRNGRDNSNPDDRQD